MIGKSGSMKKTEISTRERRRLTADKSDKRTPLARALSAKNMTQEKLAIESDLSLMTCAHACRGLRISRASSARIAEVMQMPPESLFPNFGETR